MLKEPGFANTVIFVILQIKSPSGLKTGLLRLILIFRKGIPKMKLSTKCLQNDAK